MSDTPQSPADRHGDATPDPTAPPTPSTDDWSRSDAGAAAEQQPAPSSQPSSQPSSAPAGASAPTPPPTSTPGGQTAAAGSQGHSGAAGVPGSSGDDTATPPSGERYPVAGGPGQPYPGQQSEPYPGQQSEPYPGRPTQAYPGQQSEPYPGQPGQPGQSYPGQPGQPYPGQPGQPYPGQQHPGQPGEPYPGQAYPGQAYPGQPYPGQQGPAYTQPYPGPDSGRYPPPPPGWMAPVTIKPGVVPLRPLSVTEILDGAVSTVRKHPKLLLGVSFIVVAITQIISSLLLALVYPDLEAATVDPNNPPEDLGPILGSLFGTLGLTLVLTLLAQVFLSGFVTIVVSKAVLGWPVTMREAWGELKERLLPLLGLTVLFTLVTTVGLILCIAPGVWLWVLFGLAVPAMMFERQPVMASFKRSVALVKGAWWRTFGILLLATVITFLISAILQIPFSLLGAVLSGGETGYTTIALTFDTIGATIGGALVYPISAAVTALVYLDRRMRSEGLDIELARTVGVPSRDQTW